MTRRLPALLFAAALVAAGSACINREVSEVKPNQNGEQYKDIPVELNRDIDILFVVDNSGSMAEEQNSLEQNFNRFINVLANIEGGLPNVHIGVVSTDVGAGPFNISGCSGEGDNGVLQNVPRKAGCSPPSGQFIVDIANPDGTRQTNYTGDLAETFGCIAKLGTDGCGFEQPLESALRALDGRNAQNQGFLRKDAFLAIIIISDEDDCSTEDENMFDTAQNSIDDPLGPLSSFRCFEFGVKCNPDNPRQPGTKAECAPREDSRYMYPVQHYIDFFKGLKDDPQQVIVAGIIGNPEPVVVAPDMNGNPELQPSCQSGSGEAAPAVRIKTFLDAFPQRNTVTTICNEDLSDALTVIAELLKAVIGTPCLEGNIKTDPIECQVSDVRFPGTDRQEETPMAKCDNEADPASSSVLPCWVIEEDPMQCADTETRLAVKVFPENRSVPTGTHTIVRCVVE
ncbi:MAG: VWA domain-containing protein [Deltaproteobacteria bacterium]|nr:MAG: VWA domain-containing protein [Deltaproteobacteria bacterium]